MAMLKKMLMVMGVVGAAAIASADDVSGAWEVDGSVASNPVKFTCTIKQAGNELSGTARVQEKDQPVTGKVQDKTVTFKFEVEHNGGPLLMEFTGTLGRDKDMNGTFAVAGATGDFTAKRQPQK